MSAKYDRHLWVELISVFWEHGSGVSTISGIMLEKLIAFGLDKVIPYSNAYRNVFSKVIYYSFDYYYFSFHSYKSVNVLCSKIQ